jgi:uncharacterized SAM-binding protein YcdF (DUF218 family)/glycosyltransferase involved in cell wall biosynthesis
MLKGENVLCISSIDWDFIWQGHQQIMSMLAAQGSNVLFIENTGARRPKFRDVPRLRRRIQNWWRGTKGFRRERENLFVYSPLLLPFPYSRIARWINRFIILRAVRRWMSAMGIQHPLVWTFLPTALALDLTKAVEPSLVVYYCIDDIAASSPGARGIRRTEDRLFREADLVFVTSERLRERVRRLREQVDVFPFGVDYGRFEAVRLSSDDTPADLSAMSRPIVGYVGGLHRWVDQDLVAGAARRLPAASFVLIGPPQCDISTLEREPNVHLLGARSHDQLPGYIKAFDVGVVPYAFSDYTANVYPTKLNEYLAMGIPVVATGLAEIQRFNHAHGDVVAIADDADAFATEVQRAIQQRDDAQVQKRIDVARGNSWDARLDAMAGLIMNALAARQVHRPSWDSSLRRLYRAARTRTLRTAAIVTASYLLVFYSPLLWVVAEPLRVVETPRSADAIVVFAGGAGESATAGGGYQERVRQAVDLYDAGYAPRLIFSTGFVYAFREAEVMRGLALDLGVSAESIILEDRAASTYENVVFSRDIARQHDVRRVLLVSSPYHMRRALWTWREQVPDIEVVATPVPGSQYYSHGYGANIQQFRGIAWEYAAILYYWSKGWL